VRYDDAAGELHIGQRQGAGFDGMAASRSIGVRWIHGTDTPPAQLDAPPDLSVEYRGEPLTLRRN
jgi:alpha-D-xyloside xylohydrolase